MNPCCLQSKWQGANVHYYSHTLKYLHYLLLKEFHFVQSISADRFGNRSITSCLKHHVWHWQKNGQIAYSSLKHILLLSPFGIVRLFIHLGQKNSWLCRQYKIKLQAASKVCQSRQRFVHLMQKKISAVQTISSFYFYFLRVRSRSRLQFK